MFLFTDEMMKIWCAANTSKASAPYADTPKKKGKRPLEKAEESVERAPEEPAPEGDADDEGHDADAHGDKQIGRFALY